MIFLLMYCINKLLKYDIQYRKKKPSLFDRELCSKVLKEAWLLLFLLLLAWKHEQKMFQMEQKMFTNENVVQNDIIID